MDGIKWKFHCIYCAFKISQGGHCGCFVVAETFIEKHHLLAFSSWQL